MRGILFIFFFSLFLSGFAQYGQQENQQEEPQKKKQKPEDQLILDINHDNWLNVPENVKVNPFSRGVGVFLMYDLPIGTSNFSVAAGAGISSHNIFMNAQVAEFTEDSTVLVPFPDSYEYDLHKLSTNYADVPLEFRFRTKPDKRGNRFKYAIGGRIGYLVNVHTKTIDDTGKYKAYNYETVTEIRYGLVARFSYGRVGLSYYYSLTPLFEPGNQGHEITPISAGISILPF